MIEITAGDHVTPINDHWHTAYGPPPKPGAPHPAKGGIYTTHSIFEHPRVRVVALRLVEFPGRTYTASAFRKVPPLDFDFRKLKQKEPCF